MCTVCIANNTRARPGARARQRTLTHIDTHTDTHTDPGGGSGSARQREPPRKRETRRRVQLRGGRCAPARAPRHPQPARERRSLLFMRRPRLLAAASSAPPPGRAPHSRQQLPGLARGCVVWGLLPRRRGCHLPGRCPGVPGRGKFLRLHSGALHLRTPPRPSHLHAGPGCDFTLPRAPPAAAAAKFRPSRSARCGGAGVTCVKFRLSVGVAFRTLHHHLLFFFILHCDGGRENRQKGDCRWLTYDF